MTSTAGPIAQPERLALLDILRGVALLGMFMVHLSSHATGGGMLGVRVMQAMSVFVTDKARGIFGILFGVGFAMMLRRADARGENISWRFLCRLSGVAALGFFTIVFVAKAILLTYAIAGLALLLVRRWTTRRLVAALLVSAMLPGLWNSLAGAYQWATMGAERANLVYAQPTASAAELEDARELEQAMLDTSFTRLAAARIHVAWGVWSRFLPDEHHLGTILGAVAGEPFTLFLLGLLALRLGLLDRARDHRTAILGAMAVGATLAIIEKLEAVKAVWPFIPVIPAVRVAEPVYSGFGLPAALYLAVTYIGAIALLVSTSPTWERRLGTMFGWAGRQALTNYLLQGVCFGLLFNRFGLGITALTPQLVPVVAAAFFVAVAAASRWWLIRFRFGPVEWLLRSLTYAKWQPLRRLLSAFLLFAVLWPSLGCGAVPQPAFVTVAEPVNSESPDLPTARRVSTLVESGRSADERIDGVNVGVLGRTAIATFLSTRPGPRFLRVLRVFRADGDRIQPLARLEARLIPSPGPDPWRPDYWDWRFAPRIPAPPETGDDHLGSESSDSAAEQTVKALISRLLVIGTASRTQDEEVADIAFLDQVTAESYIAIDTLGGFAHRYPGAAPTTSEFAFARVSGAIRVSLFDDIAIAQWRVTDAVGEPRYFHVVEVLERRNGLWRRVVGSRIRLVPQGTDRPWGWMHPR